MLPDVLTVPLLAAVEESAYEIDVFDQILQSRGVVLGVLLVLIVLSLVSWFIVGYKWLLFARLRRQSAQFLQAFWNSRALEDVRRTAEVLHASPLARIFEAGWSEFDRVQAARGGDKTRADGLDNVQRAVTRAANDEMTRLERMVPFLATTGSSAPFIGLFGTVWGIMNAFAYIHPDRPILETVTPHIAQALVATAIGLLAAIPAVMAYNYFISKIKRFSTQMEAFATDLLNILRRHYI
jgi:biopolymer transport protein TolQ